MDVKRKIAFVIGGHETWMVIKSVYEAARNKNVYCYVVLLKCASKAYYENFRKELEEEGVEVYYADEYKIEKDLPDACIYDFDYERAYVGDKVSVDPINAKKYAKKIVMIPYDMIVYDGYGSIAEVSKRYLRQNADMCFVNPDYYQKFKSYQSNLIMEGNPKFDYIYEKLDLKDMQIPDEWKKKIGDKKVVLWATAHGLDSKIIQPLYTFDIWVKDIIEFFQTHKEYVLIYRPYKVFEDLILSGVCSYKECRHFEEMFKAEDNFIFDETPDYGLAYSISDAMLCPPNGMLMSYLPTKKPIMYTATYRMNYSFNDEQLIQNYYIIKNRIEMEKAIDDIFHHDDPLYEKRMETLKQYVPHFDGKIGERIMEQILNKLDE